MKLNNQSIHRIILLALFLSIHLFSFSQISKSERLFEKALKQYHKGKYKSSIHSAEKIIRADSAFMDAYILLGNIYEEQHKSIKALYFYDFAFSELTPTHIGTYIHAIKLKLDEHQFESAINNCTMLLNSKLLNDEEIKSIKHLRAVAEFRKSAYLKPSDFNPVNLGKGINTSADEYINALNLINDKILFTRKLQTLNTKSDLPNEELILAAVYINESWKQQQIPEISEEKNHHLGAATISSDGRYLLFTACYHPDNYGNCDLYYIDLWADSMRMRNMGSKINTKAWESQPYFSADGQTLYFASKRQGGYGGSDLWMCKLDDHGYWSEARNLGPQINTTQDEMAPFLHPDGTSFFFSSKGHIGMGGFDLFRSKLDTAFSKAQNLGYPLNTEADEINLLVSNNGSTSYISAEREEGFGGIDMYTFELEKKHRANPRKVLNGRVIDLKTETALMANIELNKVGNPKPIAHAISNAETGNFRIIIPDTSLALSISKASYLFKSLNISLSTNLNDTLIIGLQKIEIGALSKLENVFFYTDRYNLQKASFVELDKIVKFLNNNSSLIIEIAGHTDNTGTSDYNLSLSEQRAKAVSDYLITNGISESRIQTRAYGFSKPLVPNDSEENRALNRRTEIRIIGI